MPWQRRIASCEAFEGKAVHLLPKADQGEQERSVCAPIFRRDPCMLVAPMKKLKSLSSRLIKRGVQRPARCVMRIMMRWDSGRAGGLHACVSLPICSASADALRVLRHFAPERLRSCSGGERVHSSEEHKRGAGGHDDGGERATQEVWEGYPLLLQT